MTRETLATLAERMDALEDSLKGLPTEDQMAKLIADVEVLSDAFKSAGGMLNLIKWCASLAVALASVIGGFAAFGQWLSGRH